MTLTMVACRRAAMEHFRLSINDMVSKRRTVALARPRQVAMYLCHHFTAASYPEIARFFGNRDHSTVVHAVQNVERLRASDPMIDEAVTVLSAQLQILDDALVPQEVEDLNQQISTHIENYRRLLTALAKLSPRHARDALLRTLQGGQP